VELQAFDGNFRIWKAHQKRIKEVSRLWLLNPWMDFFTFCADLMYLNPSAMPESILMRNVWGLPKWQEETPKRQNLLESFAFGALLPMECGVTYWEPIMVNFAEYHGGLGPPWQALQACCCPPAACPGLGAAYLNINFHTWKSCDRSHLIYRQASLARASHGGLIFVVLMFEIWKMLTNIFNDFFL